MLQDVVPVPPTDGRDEAARRAADQGVRELFERHYRSLCRMAALVVDDRDQAEEVVMDALLSVHRSWHRIVDPERREAYLRRAVVNGCRSALRRRRSERSAVRLVAARARAAPVDPGEEQWVLTGPVSEAVRALPPKMRAAVVLRYFADLAEDDIADALGCSVGTVKSQLSKARAHLATALRDLGVSPEEVRP